MLLEFSCSNYKSIKEKVTFSFLATKDDTNEEELKELPKFRVLRSAVVYGPNGSGKSNFLDAIRFMTSLVVNSIKNQPGDYIKQFSHKLNSDQTPTSFSVQFMKDDVRYAYGFTIQERIIKKEYLFYFPNGRQKKIFEREEQNIKAGDKYKTSFGLSLDALKDNRLFFSCAANYTQIKEIEQAFLFFKEDIVIYNPELNNWMEYSMSLIQDNEKNKQLFIDVLTALGTGIVDINAKIEKRNLDETSFPKGFTEKMQFILPNEINYLDVKVKYNNFETDLLTEESKGIKKLFEMICPIIDIISKGKILICDEIETSLHEVIVWEIVKLFKKANLEKFAQLIFSTHDTSLLDSDLFRRDQIWFTELDENRATQLYSLAEIKNVRKTENLKNGYISGKYSAIPIRAKNISSLLD